MLQAKGPNDISMFSMLDHNKELCFWVDASDLILSLFEILKYFHYLQPAYFLSIISSCVNPQLAGWDWNDCSELLHVSCSWAEQDNHRQLSLSRQSSQGHSVPVYMVRSESPLELSHRQVNQSLSDLPTQQPMQERDYKQPLAAMWEVSVITVKQNYQHSFFDNQLCLPAPPHWLWLTNGQSRKPRSSVQFVLMCNVLLFCLQDTLVTGYSRRDCSTKTTSREIELKVPNVLIVIYLQR